MLRNCGKKELLQSTPTIYSFGNTSFLFLFAFVLSKAARFFSGLFSGRYTSKTRATACTQRSSEHLGVPLSQVEKASDMDQNLPVGKCAFTPLVRHKMSFWMHTWINQSMLGEFFDKSVAGCSQDQTLKSMQHCYAVTFDFKNTVNTCSWNGNC